MSQVQDLHRQAMDLAEQADLKRLRGDTSQVQDLLRQALELGLAEKVTKAKRTGRFSEVKSC